MPDTKDPREPLDAYLFALRDLTGEVMPKYRDHPAAPTIPAFANMAHAIVDYVDVCRSAEDVGYVYAIRQLAALLANFPGAMAEPQQAELERQFAAVLAGVDADDTPRPDDDGPDALEEMGLD